MTVEQEREKYVARRLSQVTPFNSAYVQVRREAFEREFDLLVLEQQRQKETIGAAGRIIAALRR